VERYIQKKALYPERSGLSVTVNAFYDGSNTWHARCYINETGNWSWKSVSSRDFGLDSKSGFFSAVDSDLRGKLKKHPENNSALATENGKWFLNIGDTPYYLFQKERVYWKEFIRDSWNKGITLVRASMIGALIEWDSFFDNGNPDKLNINNFQTNDTRLIWMRADNGVTLKTYFNQSGEDKLLVSPWSGIDVVLNLYSGTALGVKLLPSISSMNSNDILSAQPNPFDTSTSIQVNLSENTQMHLDIFNIQGRFIERLAYGNFNDGAYQFRWNAENQPVGIYIIKLKTESRAYSRRINLVR